MSGFVSRVLCPGSQLQSRRRSFIFARRLLAASIAIYPNVQRDGPPRDVRNESSAFILFDLAPGGVCQAGRVTPTAGALLPHRFSLATRQNEYRGTQSDRSAVYSLLHFP